MCFNPGFVVPFSIRYRQSRFSLTLKGPRSSGMINGTGFSLRSPAVLAPNSQSVSLSFEALKPGFEFSSLVMKVLDGIFFQYKTVHLC